jgi:hypothetical protein
MEEEREERNNVRLKHAHPALLQGPITGHLPFLQVNKNEELCPTHRRSEQNPYRSDTNWFSEQLNNEFQHSTYEFNEGLPQAQSVGRKKIKPQKKKCKAEIPPQMGARINTLIPEGSYKGEQLYPIVANQLTLEMIKVNQNPSHNNNNQISGRELSKKGNVEGNY